VTAEVQQIGADFFRCLGSFYILFGLSTAIRGYLEGVGDVMLSGLIGIIMLAVRIILSYALKDVYGNMVIAWAEIYAWSVMLILYILRAVQKVRKT